ncbi:MAG: tetratricopeptide repeat protein [Treponema sp.]|nr:tetratricopeptide repeat protein [Treponema sp.]
MTDTIIFLAVPESLRGQVESMADDDDAERNFSIDPDIPIPVEITVDNIDGQQLNLEELSWEMIISGMLRVIAGKNVEKVSPHWITYYRHFVLTVKPAIMGEFTEAAILKARNGDFDLALEILDALRGLFPFSPIVTLNRALVMEERASMLERQGRAEAGAAFEDAEAAYTEALDTSFPDAYCNAGFFYLGRKNFSRARECFAWYVEYGEDEAKIKQVQSIVKDIDKNGLDDASFSDAYALIQQGKEEAGMRCIRDFIEDHPLVWNGWFVLGWALRRLSRWEEGTAAFGKAIELGGTGSDTRNELAICLMESGDLNGARRELETALHDDPENITVISNLGVLAMKEGNTEEAAAFFRTVLTLDPEDPVAKKFLRAFASS